MTRPQTPCENTSTRPAKVELWPVSRTYVSKQQNHLMSLKRDGQEISTIEWQELNIRFPLFFSINSF